MKKHLIILFLFSMIACHTTTHDKAKQLVAANIIKSKVELYYFHQCKGCPTCKAVGKIAGQFVSDNYTSVKDSNVTYYDVNISDKSNHALAEKFKVNWSGLCIMAHTSKGDVTENLTEFAFMYALDKPDTINKVLKSKINRYLTL